MTDITFTVEDTETKGRIVAHVPGSDEEAEITFSKSSPSLVIVDHTGVPDALRGQGIATKLAERMVALARERGYKTVPLCPFYKAALSRHPEWADVVA
ncbi:MAG: GNAT family N-acetyltransferase [Pseudomonadota bacterium]